MVTSAQKWSLVLVALMVGMPVASAFGAPLIYVTIKGSTTVGGPYSSVVEIAPGTTNLYYQVWIDLADVGTVNAAATINKLYWSEFGDEDDPTMHSDGINSVKFNLYQAATDGVQADLAKYSPSASSGLTVVSDWYLGTGRSKGVISSRGSTGCYDLLGVRPIRVTGDMDSIVTAPDTHQAVMIASGTAIVRSKVQDFVDSILRGSYMLPTPVEGPQNPFAGGRINGTSDELPGVPVYATMPKLGQEETDPVVAINSLVMYMPGVRAEMQGDSFTVSTGEDLDLAALAGGHNATYDWLIASTGTKEYSGQTVKVPWADLLSLGYGLHEITLTVHSGDLTAEDHATLNILPEPATMALLALGGLAVAARRRRAF
jgi:hypothetical protein